MTVQLEKDWTSVFGTCLEGLPGECLSYLKRTWQLSFAKPHLNKPQDFVNFGWDICSKCTATFGKRLMQHISTNSSYQLPSTVMGGVMIWEKRKLPRFSNSPVEVQPSNRFNLKKAAHKQMPGNLDGLKQLYKVGQNSSRVMWESDND